MFNKPVYSHVSTAETTRIRERRQQSLSHETTAVVVSISHLRHYFHKLLYNFYSRVHFKSRLMDCLSCGEELHMHLCSCSFVPLRPGRENYARDEYQIEIKPCAADCLRASTAIPRLGTWQSSLLVRYPAFMAHTRGKHHTTPKCERGRHTVRRKRMESASVCWM